MVFRRSLFLTILALIPALTANAHSDCDLLKVMAEVPTAMPAFDEQGLVKAIFPHADSSTLSLLGNIGADSRQLSKLYVLEHETGRPLSELVAGVYRHLEKSGFNLPLDEAIFAVEEDVTLAGKPAALTSRQRQAEAIIKGVGQWGGGFSPYSSLEEAPARMLAALAERYGADPTSLASKFRAMIQSDSGKDAVYRVIDDLAAELEVERAYPDRAPMLAMSLVQGAGKWHAGMNGPQELSISQARRMIALGHRRGVPFSDILRDFHGSPAAALTPAGTVAAPVNVKSPPSPPIAVAVVPPTPTRATEDRPVTQPERAAPPVDFVEYLKTEDVSRFPQRLVQGHEVFVSDALLHYYAEQSSKAGDAGRAILAAAAEVRRRANDRGDALKSYELPNPDYIGHADFWSQAFSDANRRGARMTAALLLALPDPESAPDYVRNEVRSLLARLARLSR